VNGTNNKPKKNNKKATKMLTPSDLHTILRLLERVSAKDLEAELFESVFKVKLELLDIEMRNVKNLLK
jgi:hypothetical protein